MTDSVDYIIGDGWKNIVIRNKLTSFVEGNVKSMFIVLLLQAHIRFFLFFACFSDNSLAVTLILSSLLRPKFNIHLKIFTSRQSLLILGRFRKIQKLDVNYNSYNLMPCENCMHASWPKSCLPDCTCKSGLWVNHWSIINLVRNLAADYQWLWPSPSCSS